LLLPEQTGAGGGGLSPSKPLVSQPPPIVSRPSATSPLINSGYKTPLQIFSGEVMAAAKRRLPNLDNAQLQKIVVDKWTKMTDREKQVYRAKSLAYAKLASGRVGEGGRGPPNAAVLAARPPVVTSTVLTTGSPRLSTSTVLTPRIGIPASSLPAAIAVSSGAAASPGLVTRLPPGWRRTLVQKKEVGESGGAGRYEVCLHTPTGERLRTKAELLSYTKRHNLDNISEDILHFRRPVHAQVISGTVVSRPGPTVFRPGPAVPAETVTINASGGGGGLKIRLRRSSTGHVIQPAAAPSDEKSSARLADHLL